jgi:hypothetical protein
MLWPFGLFYDHLVHFVAIWYILCFFGILFPALVWCAKKNLATLCSPTTWASNYQKCVIIGINEPSCLARNMQNFSKALIANFSCDKHSWRKNFLYRTQKNLERMNLCQTKLQKTNNRGNAMITILGDF